MPVFNPLLNLNQLMEIPDVVWDYPERETNWYILKNHFDNRACEFNGILMKRFMKFPAKEFMEQSFRSINFADYIDDEGSCGDVCLPGESFKDCGDNEFISCPTNQRP